jgi:sortase B
MAEEFRNRQADEDLLKLDPEIYPEAAEDLRVTGKHKSHKKKKSKPIYTILIIILLGVMGYSGYQILSTLLRDAEANKTYDNIINSFVVEVDDTTKAGQQTKPEPAASGENTQPSRTQQETESGEVIVPVDPEMSAGEPASTDAEADPMRILSVDFDKLKGINSDVVAWLQGQGGSLSYPVVKGKDNEYYLKHLIDGSYNGNGTLFVHCENRFLQDDITYIFGHHMYGGAMFGSLKNYDSTEYYWKNTDFRLYTPEKTYTLRIIAVMYGTGTEHITFNYANADDFNVAMRNFASRSLHPAAVQAYYADKIVCLCTCAYHVENGRYFIYCKVMD